MARTNKARGAVLTHEGAPAQNVGAVEELRRAVMTCMLFENTFYEGGAELAKRIEDLCRVVDPHIIDGIAREARNKMYLRHVPLFLARQLARHPIRDLRYLVADLLEDIIQRPDELAEYLALYWKEQGDKRDRKNREHLSGASKRGLARAFGKFNEYQLGKWNQQDRAIKLRDVMFLTHPKRTPLTDALTNKTLSTPDTWEVELSAGKDKRETFERLLRERKLGGLAVLRNLRNMMQAGVDRDLIAQRLRDGIKRALPFRFITAARYAPQLELEIEQAMLAAVADVAMLPGRTGLLIDVSGSMIVPLSFKSEMTREDAAAALAILLREKAEQVEIATFSENAVTVPPRRGFALRDAVHQSQAHGSTNLGRALTTLAHPWRDIDRLIVITDEQSHDRVQAPWCPKAYIINVATYQNGVGYGNGWTHINGWSERVVEYIGVTEGYNAAPSEDGEEQA